MSRVSPPFEFCRGYGDRGFSSNIAVPSVVMHSKSTQKAGLEKGWYNHDNPWTCSIACCSLQHDQVRENELPNVFDSANAWHLIQAVQASLEIACSN